MAMPREDAAQALLAIVAELLRETRPAGAPSPAPRLDSRLERDLGIDSLARVELLLRIERAFGVRLPEPLLGEAETPRDLLRAVLAGAPGLEAALAAAPIVHAPEAAESAPAEAATLLEVLDWHVERHPDRLHVLVMAGEEDGEGTPITYGQLRSDARAVAAGIARLGIGAGDAVALMLPTSRDFFRAFMGILMAGAVPVPIYPPLRRAGIAEHLRRQARILDNCRARMLVTVPEGARAGRMLRGLVPTLERVAGVDELASPGEAAALPARGASDVALLQYTSGSTGDPKGVVLTHANLLANIRAMGRAVSAGPDDVFVSWLPLYHDMGLIGAWMGGLHFAFPLVVMSPAAFVNRPARWLRAIHRYRGTMSSAPNFAYEILASRVDESQLEGLDLAAWRLAFNGAEPVSPDTLERFAARFARFGFRREALMPVYGLAESAVGLAFPEPGRGPRVDRVDREALARTGEARPAAPGDEHALRFVACGQPLPGHEIRILGADGLEAPERIEGRIQFRGPSATGGYFRNPGKSRELFDGEWLDTGDLGYLATGELFVTGRSKDLIIRGGQHAHPYEIEEAVGRIPGVRKGCVAVFGVADAASGTERIVVLAETRLAPGAARDALRGAVAACALAHLGAPADDVVLAPPHTVLKTSSGKIRRAASRELYLKGLGHAPRGLAWRPLAGFVASLAAARLRRAGRAAAQLARGAWLWSLAAVLGAVALAATLLPAGRARWRAMRALARTMVRAARMPVAIHGLERIPLEGPAILVANHASYLDGPLLFALLPRPVRFVAKRELADHLVVRRVLGAAGVSFVERFDVEAGAEATRELARLARGGEALVFFAEGTFTRAPGLAPFRMGAFVASAQSGAPVIPLALRGTRSILREGQWRPRRSAIVLHVGAPLPPGGDDWAAAARLRDAVRAEVLAHCGEPDLERAA